MLEQPYFFEKVLMVQELLTVLSDHIHHMESERSVPTAHARIQNVLGYISSAVGFIPRS